MAGRSRSFSSLGKIWTLVALCGLSGCGETEDKEAGDGTVYGNMTVADSKTLSDAGTFSLTSAEKCSRNIDTGLVDIVISRGAGKAALTIAIKDFSASPKLYTCKQAADNQTSATDVGGKFESCRVESKVLSTGTATTLNVYSMYRETIAIEPFTYNGACTIDIASAVPAISGSVVCTDLVQTQRNGSVRNPIDLAVTADLKADFNCTFK